MKDYRSIPLSQLLCDREIFAIFDEEFQKESWLDVTVLVHSEGSIDDVLKDGLIPEDVMLRIVNRLDKVI